MSEGETEIVIPLSRGKIIALTLGSLAFVAVCFWLWSIPEDRGLFSLVFRKVVSVAGSGLGGICAIYGCFKLFDKKAGLVIDGEGIIDNSSGVAAGRILWNEIVGFHENEIAGQRFLTIEVSDPERFLNRGGFLKAKLNAANLNMTGSPINISASSLSIGFDELMETLTRALEARDTSPRNEC